MTIHIPLFWCGVGATLIAEFLLCVTYAVATTKPKTKRKNIGDK